MVDNGGAGSTQQPPKPKKKLRLEATYTFIKKYWYIAGAALAVLISVAVWQVLMIQNDKAWQQATDYYKRADYTNAGKILDNMAIPRDEEKLRIYAQTMLATGKLDTSLEAYTRLYESTSDASVKMYIGNIYNQQEQYDDAEKIYKEIIASNSSNVQAYVNLATVYRLKGDNAAAAKIAQDAVEKNPANVTLLELRVSMLLEDKTTPEYKKAVAALKAANPQDPLLKSINQ